MFLGERFRRDWFPGDVGAGTDGGLILGPGGERFACVGVVAVSSCGALGDGGFLGFAEEILDAVLDGGCA